MNRGKLVVGGLILVVLVGAAAWLGYTGMQTTDEVPLMATPEYDTVAVQRGDVERRLAVPGELAPIRQTGLAFPGGGRLVEMLVRPGDTVASGQPLARLDTADLEVALKRAETSLQAQEAALADLQAPPNPVEVAVARAELSSAEARLAELQAKPDPVEVELARLNLEQARNNLWSAQVSRDTITDGPGRKQAEAAVGNAEIAVRLAEIQYQQAQAGPSPTELAAAQAAVAQARVRLDDLLAGPAAEELTQARVRVDEARMEFEVAQAALDAAVLIAPFAGTVLDVLAEEGATAGAGQAVVELADLGVMEVRTTVGEEDIVFVQPGQPSEVILDALPEMFLSGQVTRVIPHRAEGSQVVTYEVRVFLDETPPGVLPDMSADVEIVVARRQDVLVLPRRALRVRRGVAQVAVLEGGVEVTRTVEIGLEGDLYVEILSGLEEGDVVVRKGR